ncbi:MAG: type II secretion system secretin GspD [Bacteriovoracaceae bacterium]|nr:type II secretion system secretin GspD [Bacteriovoracaceae bacterium]
MKQKWIFTLILTSFILLPIGSFAQFNKYKSKTNFNNSKTSPAKHKKMTPQKSPALNKVTEDRKKNNNIDDFGRKTTSPKKSSKYVDINFDTAFGPQVIESFNYPEISLIDLTKDMQELTGINLIIDKEIKGKVTIMAPTAITVGDAWKAYLSALNMAGYSLVKSGAFYKIIPNRDVRYHPTKIYTGTYSPNTENYVMRVIPLKYISSSEVTRNFRPFMSRFGRITDIKETNTIIVQDTGTNITRLIRLIQFVDIPGHEESLQIIKVKYSSAQEIAKLLDQILKSKTTKKFRSSLKRKTQNISKIIAEPRTNSIITMANAEGEKQLRNLINKLDVREVTSGGQIHVYYLNHGNAEDLSKTLSSLVSSSGSKSTSKSRFTKSGFVGSSSLFNAEVKITSDKSNNAIVVTASPTDYLVIKEIIKKLDIPRDQVYVEGMIMETNVSKGQDVGITLIGAYGTGGTERIGYGGQNKGDIVNLLTDNITSLGGLFAGGGFGKKVTVSMGGEEKQVRSVMGLISAIATDNNTNVLATPQLLVLDNEEGVFEVGETIPTPERSTAANGSTTVAIKQQKVGMTLKISPQINKISRFVKLKIDQKIEDFSERQLPAGVANDGIATTTRSTVTTVVARDMDTIAMGGLMRDKEVTIISKVPVLGDIPILGWLFKSKGKRKTKVNLLFFLTPRILASYEKANAKNLKDIINRRATHLKKVLGDEDPFGTTVKGLYEKAKKQEQGPLYDPDTRNINEGTIGPQSNSFKYKVPDYSTIIQKVITKRASVDKSVVETEKK